ncbi:MAG: hypothetical protein LIQ30_09360 [Planctomycetes bacterium]|nr:hypothetical protein [Planctomycetota bacterium]MCD7897247.1 hypothetical protein [Planctomycetaceae bacterium]
MDEQGGGKGVWIGLIAAILVAVVFLVLWFMRGGEVDRLTRELALAQSGAASAQQRLQSELDAARNTATTGARRITELEQQLADEQRRAGDNATQLERRLRSEIDAAQAGYRAASRELEELRAAQAEAESAAIAQLQAQIEDHAYTIESVRADNRLLAQRLDEARESLAQATSSAAETESVESLQAEADRLATELQEAEAARESVVAERDQARADLQSAREAAARREDEMNAATERLEAENTRLRTEVEGLEETVRQLHNDLDRLEQALGGNTETAGADENAAAVTDDLATAGVANVATLVADQVAELRSRVTTLQEENAALTARLEEAQTALGREVGAVEREREELSVRLEETTARLAREKEELVQEIASLTSRLDEALTARQAGEEEAGSLAELRRELTVRQERYAAERNRLQEEIEQLRDELGKNRETIRAMEIRLEQEAGRAGDREAVSRAAAPNQDEPVVSTPLDMEDGRFPSQFVTDDPYRSVGKIVMLEKDGRTYVVNAGARQNVRPGMRFDVHRTGDDGRSRYIGLVQVVRTLDDFSWVMPVNPGVVMVCPITGRAVLEPGAQFSPFVLTESGSPVPLKSVGDLELQPEAPKAGDSIDNPFFNPDRQSTFALSREVADAVECALGAVCTLGGLATDDIDSDFLIVSERSIFEGNLVGPKRVTLQHLLKYAAPAQLSCRN